YTRSNQGSAYKILARERERKARTTLLMALPKDHLAKFHKMTDAKEMWDAIKSRFGRNDESKKMQKYILKQQFEGFSVSNSEGLHKGYDKFKSLLSQLDIHGAGVSTKDANKKFLRSLPSAWSQVSLITRTKPGVDNLSFDDLYNNLRVFESDVKGSTASSSSTQNVAFISTRTTSRVLKMLVTVYGIFIFLLKTHNDEHGFLYSLLANQSSCPQLDHEDLEQLDEFDLEEMDLKWQVAMISMRMKKFYKKTGRKLQFDAKERGFEQNKVECFSYHKSGNFARDCRIPREIKIVYEGEMHGTSGYKDGEDWMAKQAELNNRMRKKSSQKDKPVWNNVQRMNHKNRLVPKAVLTRTGKILINTARTSILINAARKVYTVKPIMNNTRPKAGFHKSVLPFRKSFNRTTTLGTNFSKQKVNTAEVNAVSVVKGKRETAVKPSAGCNWRPKRHYWNQVSKYNGRSSPRNYATFKDPLGRLKPKQAWVPKRI
ncbi:hypothetical protein Tco_1424663, partial [Tanacetum coccineum]